MVARSEDGPDDSGADGHGADGHGADGHGADGHGADDRTVDDERWLVIDGRRWRRTDPALPPETAAALTSHLGRARSAVGAASRRDDADAVSAARRRVDLAKHGLGERGDYWWELSEAHRRRRAVEALAELERLAPSADRSDG